MSPVAAHTTHVHDPRRAIALKLVSVFLFTLMGVLIKLLDGHYPTSQVVFARSFFALIPLGLIVLMVGPKALRTRRPLGHLGRGLLGLTAMIASFYALPRLPLATFTTISFTMPLFGAALAALVLKEKLSRHNLIALLIGFCGVLLVLRPDLGSPGQAELVALASALLVAVVTVVVRQLTATENSISIAVWFTVFCTLASGSLMAFEFVLPSRHDAVVLVLIGLIGGVGQIALTQSFRYGQVALLGAFEYTSLIWASLLGYFFWQEIPTLSIVSGAAIIMLSGLYMLTHATRAMRRAALSSATSKPC